MVLRLADQDWFVGLKWLRTIAVTTSHCKQQGILCSSVSFRQNGNKVDDHNKSNDDH